MKAHACLSCVLTLVLLTASASWCALTTVAAFTGTLDWQDLGEAASGESAVGPLVSVQGMVIGGTYGSGIPYLFKFDIPSSTFSPKISVPGTGSHVSRLALVSANLVYVSTSKTYGQGNLASYDPASGVTRNLGSVGDEYGEALTVGRDGKVYVATCCQGQLSIYDPQTQSWTRKGRIIANQIRHSGLATGADGNVYGVTSRIWVYPYGGAVLYKYDVTSQSTAVIGTIWPGTHESWNIVANPQDGRLYGSVGYSMTARLFAYDPANPHLGITDLGIAVEGEDGIGAGALAIAPDGKVYAVTSPNAHLVVYDPSQPSQGIVDLGTGYGNLTFGTDGYLYGTSGTHLVRSDVTTPCIAPSGLNVCTLQPGDILLKTGSTFGTCGQLYRAVFALGGTYFTHSALYLGQVAAPGGDPNDIRPRIAEAQGSLDNDADEVWETWLADTQFSTGQCVTDWVVVRPSASTSASNGAIAYARQKAVETGVVFDINATKSDPKKFYCSKLVWKSYLDGSPGGPNLEADRGLGNLLFSSQWVTPDDLFYSSPIVQEKAISPGQRIRRGFFYIWSPGHITLIDPEGRRTGYDSSTGGVHEEIPDTAYFAPPDAVAETVTAVGMGEGWRVEITGFETGEYGLESGYADRGASRELLIGTTYPGRTEVYPVHDPVYATFLPMVLRNY